MELLLLIFPNLITEKCMELLLSIFPNLIIEKCMELLLLITKSIKCPNIKLTNVLLGNFQIISFLAHALLQIDLNL